jgi:hypothetical protein
MDELVDLLDQMWDDHLLLTTQSGKYYHMHPTMQGNWKEADLIRVALRKKLVALPNTPVPTSQTFGSGNAGDKYFGQEVVSFLRRLFSK